MVSDDMDRVLARARTDLSLSASDRERHEVRLLAALVPASLPRELSGARQAADPARSSDVLRGAAAPAARGLGASAVRWVVVGVVAGGAVGVGATYALLAPTARDEAADGAPRRTEASATPTARSNDVPPPSSPAPVVAADNRQQTGASAGPPGSSSLRGGVAASPAARSPRPADARSAAPAEDTSAAFELSLLQRARRALNRNNAAQALGIVIELDERFPRGALLEERDALRVFALCDLGDAAAARTAAARFETSHPGSLYMPRVSAACAATKMNANE